MKTLKVVKIGGNIIDNPAELDAFLADFATLEPPKILIHGGGKLATKLANDLGVEVKMIEGRRITDEGTLNIITMVYAGKINKAIVAKLQANQCNALGFTGADGNSIVANKRPVKMVDYGFVGDIVKVNTNALELLLNARITPVFCALTHDENGQLLNTNADTIASALAIGFAPFFRTELYYCFEKNGVLHDVSDDDSVIQQINSKNYQSLLDRGIISDGMLPKLNNCFHAISNKVQKVCIGKSTMLFSTQTNFTTITK